MTTRKLAFGMIWMTAVAGPGFGRPGPVSARSQITVNLFDRAGLPRQIRDTMKKETTQIFREAGLELEWVDCETVGTPSPECAQSLGAGRLRMELVPGRNKKTPWVAGGAMVQGSSSVIAWLYPERVLELAQKSSWDFGELLGHAAAHELGHLLLRSTGHTPAGIMRASWEVRDLWHLPHAGLIFLPGQLRAVQAATVAKASTP
jgi:hypothetical protein